jgi:NADH-quinone oxidoreductase subunit L
MYFLVFHGAERFGHDNGHHGHDGDADDEEPAADHHHGLAAGEKPHESPWVVTAPLLLLAAPSVVIGFLTIGPMLYGDFLQDAIVVDAARHPAMAELASHFHGAAAMALHGLAAPPFWLALAGVVVAWWFYLKAPAIPTAIRARFGVVYRILENKYYMDWINERILAPAARAVGTGLWKGGDTALIDRALIDGSARAVSAIAAVARLAQTGYLYWYALVMIVGVIALMTWQLWPYLGIAALR